MKKRMRPTVCALRDAIAAIIRHNRRLTPVIRAGVSTPGLTRQLKCECNGAHKYIEDMVTAVKSLPRGAPEAQVPLMDLKASSTALLQDLETLAQESGAPPELKRPLKHAVYDAMTVEERFHNFTIGVSGASPNIAHDEYCLRLDLFVRDLKKTFDEINKALSDVEDEMSARTRSPKSPAPATKADLHTAVKTILRGEDVNAAKPGPRLSAAKQRQIETAKTYRKGHAGCTLHNACMRSFVDVPGGYKNAMALYRTMKRNENMGLST